MILQTEFPIVGIGASAGGVEALEGFFRGLPADPGLAFVVVTHLSPVRESHLPEVIQHYTPLKVQTATEAMQVEVNNVYVLPADAIMSIQDRRLRLRKRTPEQRGQRPIDTFLSALALDCGEFAAGVILSGGDSDGTLGVKIIKEQGGLTLAQSADGFGPSSPEMPGSAIATGMVDFIVPADQMGIKLADYANGLQHLDDFDDAVALGAERAQLEAAKREIYDVLRSRIGHDFSGYKSKTFMRRVQRRLQVNQLTTIQEYIDFLKQQPQEAGALFRDLLISVTNFFRDADAFDSLKDLVIPQLLKDRGATETVRIWVPGCATGEEVYSLAILLRECMSTLAVVPRVQIFATDIDDRALAVARAARYPAALLDGVSPERRDRYFVADGDSYVVSKQVRDLCIFSPHSVLRDPPFSRIDLVSCRNLLIYFGGGIQKQVIPTFHYSLRAGGYLFLGMSENVSQFGDLFSPVDKKHRIFLRRTDIGAQPRPSLTLPSMHKSDLPHSGHRRTQTGVTALRQSVDSQVLTQHAPPHVLVNRDGDIVYYSSRTGKYLEAAAGVPTRQVLTLARKGLRLDLRTLLHDAAETGHTATRENVAMDSEEGRVQMVSLTVEPLAEHKEGEPLFLILFTDQGPMLSREEAYARVNVAQQGAAQQIELELRDTRERLQSMIEEYETALEELKSSNEELVSVNEEFQSTNEELEASKEELVSLNEELHTVNAELHGKVDELDRSNSDLNNLFESTAIATLFLDRNLIIRSFTPAVGDVFNILPSDCGRPITDLASRFDLPSFASDIAQVYTHYQPIERRIAGTLDGKHYLLRLVPYRSSDSQVDGVVVTFIDVTLITRAERRHRTLITELQHRTRNLLALVQSVARRTLGEGEPFERLDTRLAALGRVQGLLTETNGDKIEFGGVVRRELDAVGSERQIAARGPEVHISPERIQTLALAVHELATNAVKYGALRYESGRLNVSWHTELQANEREHLILDWTESGVPVAPDATRRGYGRDLIEQSLAFNLGAKATLTFKQDGIVCRIDMPIEACEDESATPPAG
ncbi:CheR family methyltransferase [Achromobacter seleniivolatilans]|uniref:CheR family methyltransferase n=1 Tax=Achromobacter seleniivolatilans TaxID=3047478 RepID=A0ABY9M637_9BURK|nr:CheR family methyltransferase [Achromobacter sp. R39]WMD22456.1 CheR family methyltransferase [Achromobacter sp. R39]